MRKQLSKECNGKKKNIFRKDIHFLRKIYNTQIKVYAILVDILNEIKSRNTEKVNDDQIEILIDSHGTCPKCSSTKVSSNDYSMVYKGVYIDCYYECLNCHYKWISVNND